MGLFIPTFCPDLNSPREMVLLPIKSQCQQYSQQSQHIKTPAFQIKIITSRRMVQPTKGVYIKTTILIKDYKSNHTISTKKVYNIISATSVAPINTKPPAAFFPAAFFVT